MKERILCLLLLFASSSLACAEDLNANPNIDPLALRVLKAVTTPIQEAKDYSFRVLVSRERPSTNNQPITVFNVTDVTIEHPGNMKLDVHRRGQEVQLFYRQGEAVLYSPEAKLYSTIAVPKTLDAALDALEQKNIELPIRNFLGSDPYRSLTDGLKSAFVVGRVELQNQVVHQLAFTEKDADWQIWVTGGDHPRIVRMEMIDTSTPEKLRTTLQFFDWNFNSHPSPTVFNFTRPANAKQIDLLPER